MSKETNKLLKGIDLSCHIFMLAQQLRQLKLTRLAKRYAT